MSEGTKIRHKNNLKLNRWDHQAMTFLRAAGFARTHQVACWTASSNSQAIQRLYRLKGDGIVDYWDVSMNLTVDDKGKIEPRPIRVWYLTKRGTNILGPLTVPGSYFTVPQISAVKGLPTTSILTHNLVTIEHLLAWRAWGSEIATIRDIEASEKDGNAKNQKETVTVDGTLKRTRKPKYWLAVRDDSLDKFAASEATHAPDAGAVLDGTSWQLEIELACKDVRTYTRDLKALRSSGPNRVIWHVEQKLARKRLREAARNLAIEVGAEDKGEECFISADLGLWVVSLIGRGPVNGEDIAFDAIAHQATLPYPTIYNEPPNARRANLRSAWVTKPKTAELAGLVRGRKAAAAEAEAQAAVEAQAKAAAAEKARLKAEKEHPQAEARLVRQALEYNLPTGWHNFPKDGTRRFWDGATWSAPEVQPAA